MQFEVEKESEELGKTIFGKTLLPPFVTCPSLVNNLRVLLRKSSTTTIQFTADDLSGYRVSSTRLFQSITLK